MAAKQNRRLSMLQFKLEAGVLPKDFDADLVPVEDIAVEETRLVDRVRLVKHVKIKVERSSKGRTCALFIVFCVIYLAAVVLQRNCRDAQTLNDGFKRYLTEPTFRDPDTFELLTLHDLNNVDDIWRWFYEVFLPRVYISHYDNGMERVGKDRGVIMNFNRLTTGIRFTQRRVVNGTGIFCIRRPEFESFAKNCYGQTTLDSRFGDVDKNPFYSFDQKIKYVYMEEKAAGAPDANVGFIEKLTLSNSTSSLEDAREQLLKLQKDMWINPGTAWWRADFVTYNSNTGLFCFVKITFELMNTGEVKIGFRADTLKGRLYSSGMDLIVLFFEIVAVLLCLTFFARMWFELLRQHRESKSILPWFNDLDNCLEFTQGFVFWAILALRASIILYPIRSNLNVTADDITVSAVFCEGVKDCGSNWWTAINDFKPRTKDKNPMYFDSLGYIEEQYFNLNGVNCIFCLIRILSYLRVNPNISQLTQTFMYCRSNMVQFAFVLFVLVASFDLAAVFMFGASLPEFSNLALGFVTTARFFLGAADIYGLLKADKVAAPIFYYPFTFMMIFIVLNMTIAIIMDGYTEAQEIRKERLQWREDLKYEWLADKHPERPGWIEDIYAKSVYHQIFEGMLRLLSPLVWAGLVPAWVRKKKLRSTGEVYDRFAMPDLRTTLALLSALENDEKGFGRFMTWTDFYGHVASVSSKYPMNEHTAKWIVNRYNAWQKTPLDAAFSHDVDELETQEEEMLMQRIANLQERASLVVRQHKMLNQKVDMILRSIAVPEEVHKKLTKKVK